MAIIVYVNYWVVVMMTTMVVTLRDILRDTKVGLWPLIKDKEEGVN